jgi:hypothetical protein
MSTPDGLSMTFVRAVSRAFQAAGPRMSRTPHEPTACPAAYAHRVLAVPFDVRGRRSRSEIYTGATAVKAGLARSVAWAGRSREKSPGSGRVTTREPKRG